MNKRVLTTLLAGALSASMVIPAFATISKDVTVGSNGGAVPTLDGTEVHAGIIVNDPDAKFKVEVPTLFAFVVSGTIDANQGTTKVSSADGTILLPNVTVKVTDPSTPLDGAPGEAKFTINTTSDSVMKFTNYSTYLSEKDGGLHRVGLDVDIMGSIENEGEAVARNYWEHVAEIKGDDLDPTKPNDREFKKYTLSVDGKKFSVAKGDGVTFEMDSTIRLDAPELGWDTTTFGNAATYTNIESSTGLAKDGLEKVVAFDVEVGGSRGQYKQIEESAKIGTIVWTISREFGTTGVYTAPENEYLDGNDTLESTDPDGIELETGAQPLATPETTPTAQQP